MSWTTAPTVPHGWFTADSEFGRVNAFRAGLRQRGERYVVDVRSDLRIRDLREMPPARKGDTGRFRVRAGASAEQWAAIQPAPAWQRFKIRDGEKGPLMVEAIETRVQTFEDTRVGRSRALVVIRTVSSAAEAQTWYCLSNAGAEVPLARGGVGACAAALGGGDASRTARARWGWTTTRCGAGWAGTTT